MFLAQPLLHVRRPSRPGVRGFPGRKWIGRRERDRFGPGLRHRRPGRTVPELHRPVHRHGNRPRPGAVRTVLPESEPCRSDTPRSDRGRKVYAQRDQEGRRRRQRLAVAVHGFLVDVRRHPGRGLRIDNRGPGLLPRQETSLQCPDTERSVRVATGTTIDQTRRVVNTSVFTKVAPRVNHINHKVELHFSCYF